MTVPTTASAGVGAGRSAAAIVLVDANASDMALAESLLQPAFPDARISRASDVAALDAALAAGPVDAVVVAPALPWASAAELAGLIARRAPAAALIVFGGGAEFEAACLQPGMALEGVVRKDSAGFMALPGILARALERRHGAEPGGAAPVAPEIGDIAMLFSHDLKAPVQQIGRLLQRLDGQGRAGEAESRRILEQIGACARRAGDMIDSTLEYLAIAASAEPYAPLSLDECLGHALESLAPVIEDTGAEVSSDPLPEVFGDALQLQHLFQNVIGNAIKFRGREPPRVRITAEPAGRHWRISIADNGIGIDAGFRESVFQMGRRLHTAAEYPGSGIGLTLCRRIVERHGGRIRIEAGTGGGSTVVVELPGAREGASGSGGQAARSSAP